MTLQIREATAKELPQVLALYAQPGMNEGHALDVAQAREIFDQFARYPSYRLFVAGEVGAPEKLLGSYALLIMHNLAHMGTPAAIVEDVVVDRNRRRQGIGRQMMDHAVAQARAAGCYKLALSSNRKREQAHAFYESLGFELHGYSYVIDPQNP
jgi:ribosomal protein S18 acetylase RimI-like enzyme